MGWRKASRVRRDEKRTSHVPNDDGLNNHVWDTIIEMVDSARRGDAKATVASTLELKESVATSIMYLDFVLRQIVARRVKAPKPTDEQIRSLVESASLYLRVLGPFADDQAELALRELFSSVPIPDAPKGATLLTYYTVLLAGLVAEPRKTIPPMRGYVVRKSQELMARAPGKFEYLLVTATDPEER